MAKLNDGDYEAYMTFLDQFEELMEKLEDLMDVQAEDKSWYNHLELSQ